MLDSVRTAYGGVTRPCGPSVESLRPQGILILVGVAERLRRQVVALEIEGSNPSVHPILSLLR